MAVCCVVAIAASLRDNSNQNWRIKGMKGMKDCITRSSDLAQISDGKLPRPLIGLLQAIHFLDEIIDAFMLQQLQKLGFIGIIVPHLLQGAGYYLCGTFRFMILSWSNSPNGGGASPCLRERRGHIEHCIAIKEELFEQCSQRWGRPHQQHPFYGVLARPQLYDWLEGEGITILRAQAQHRPWPGGAGHAHSKGGGGVLCSSWAWRGAVAGVAGGSENRIDNLLRSHSIYRWRSGGGGPSMRSVVARSPDDR